MPLRIGIAAAAQAIGSTIGGIIASLCTNELIVRDTNATDKTYLIAVFISFILIVLTLFYTIVFVRETHCEYRERQINEYGEEKLYFFI